MPKIPPLRERAVLRCAKLIIAAEAMEFCAVGFKPNPGFLGGGRCIPYEPPEAGAVVHFAQMRDFMGCDIIQNKWRRKDEPP